MESFAQQFFYLLTSPPGNLVYHLVLAFSITTTLQVLLIGRSTSTQQDRTNKRMVIGLAILLSCQIFLFISSGLAWRGTINAEQVLPPLDRAIAILSLLWITWLWCFPSSTRSIDLTTGFASLAIAILFVYSASDWNNQTTLSYFNHTWSDWVWSGLGALISLGGIIYIAIKRPKIWGIGLGFLSLNLAGYISHLAYSGVESNFSAVIRFAHLCSYPLLPSLIQRSFTPTKSTTSIKEPLSSINNTSSQTTKPEAMEAWLQLTSPLRFPDAVAALTRAMTHTLNTDICILVSLDNTTDLTIEGGYNRNKKIDIKKTFLNKELIPSVHFAIRDQKLQEISTNTSNSEELDKLADAVEVTTTTGNILLVPIEKREEQQLALLLLSPNFERQWGANEQAYLASAAKAMARILQRSMDTSTQSVANDQLAVLLQEKEAIDEECEQLRLEKQELNNKFMQLQQDILILGSQIKFTDESNAENAESDRNNASKVLHLWLEQVQQENDELNEELEQLKKENELLKSEIPQNITAPPDYSNVIDELDQMVNDGSHPLDLQDDEDMTNSYLSGWDLPEFSEEDEEDITQPVKSKKIVELEKKLKSTLAAQAESQKLIVELKRENERLKEEAQNALLQPSGDDQKVENLQAQLRQTMDEIKRLESDLEISHLKLLNLEKENLSTIDNKNKLNILAQDIGQPIASITGYTDLLLSETVGKLGAAQKRFLERVKTANERISNMMNIINEMAASESSSTKTTTALVEVESIITSAAKETEHERVSKDIKLNVDIQEKLPGLSVEQDALQQIIIYLLRNATRNTPQAGTVSLQASVSKTAQNQSGLTIQVTQMGEPIPEEELPRIFEPKDDNNLDLSIAKTLAEAQRGKIWVENTPEQKTAFNLMFLTQAQQNNLADFS